MERIDCKPLSSISGSDRWVEGVLYAARLGVRLGLGNCRQANSDSELRLESARDSSYDYQGVKTASGSRSGIPTIQFGENILLEPQVALDRGRGLTAICAVAAHEAVHHRSIVEIDDFIHDGYGGKIENEYDSSRRKIILELLKVDELIYESGADPLNLDRYWTANAETWQKYHPELTPEDAALDSRNEFLCQVAACLARLHLRGGPEDVRSLVDSRSGNLHSNSDRVIPLPYTFLLEQLIESACSKSAEPEAREDVACVLGRSPVAPDAVLFRLRP